MIYLNRLLTNWNVCRIVRSIAGLSFLIYGIQIHEWPVIIFGLGWLAVGIFSLQCCADGNCQWPKNDQPTVTGTPVEFEEVK